MEQRSPSVLPFLCLLWKVDLLFTRLGVAVEELLINSGPGVIAFQKSF